MKLFVGLGNPGKKHEANRHNVGFMALDFLCDSYGFSSPQNKFGGKLAEGTIADKKIFAFYPLSYMNKSGEPVRDLVHFYKIPLEEITVFHDELDLALAKIRIKSGGGNGGHNGLKSLDENISENYQRVRIGIGHPGNKDLVHSHVLSDFSADERGAINELLKKISKDISLLVCGDTARFASKIAI